MSDQKKDENQKLGTEAMATDTTKPSHPDGMGEFVERSDEAIDQDLQNAMKLARERLRAGKPSGWERS